MSREIESIQYGAMVDLGVTENRALEKIPRLADVAKAAGVSQGTASNVFNRPHVVREEVREHVQAVARSLGYHGPDPKGRLLRAGKVNAIGIATAEPLSYFFEDPFARTLMSGISQACDTYGAGLSLVSAMNEQKLAWNVQSALVDGFVLLCIEQGPRLIALTRERQLPFVALELAAKDDTISAIGVNNFAGARLAARHLAQLGHRRFAILSMHLGDDHTGFATSADVKAAIYSSSRDRVLGYFSGLAEFGIDTATVPIFETQNEAVSVRAGLEEIFASGDPPTAILAMSDRIALAALDWLAERSLTVPWDISIIGFDGVPDAALAQPPLTTIAQPIEAIGRAAVQMILEDNGKVQRQVFDTKLVVRGSTAAPGR
jgi:DNA-binding LacI/PurR family transcriptional regulator